MTMKSDLYFTAEGECLMSLFKSDILASRNMNKGSLFGEGGNYPREIIEYRRLYTNIH